MPTGPALRVGVDQHVCPIVEPPGVPHVGGPIIGPGVPTVLIGGAPACVVGDTCTCAGAMGPAPIVAGSMTVLISGRPAARVMDATAHGSQLIGPGCLTVIIGG